MIHPPRDTRLAMVADRAVLILFLAGVAATALSIAAAVRLPGSVAARSVGSERAPAGPTGDAHDA